MEPWQQHILSGLQVRHATYVNSVHDVMAGYIHQSRLLAAQSDKHDALLARHAALDVEARSLREYRAMKEGAKETGEMERQLGKRVTDLLAANKALEAQLAAARAQLANALAQQFDLQGAKEHLQMGLEAEQTAHNKTKQDLVAEIRQLRSICESVTAKQRVSSATEDTLRAQLSVAQQDVKTLAEEKFRLQSQLLSASKAAAWSRIFLGCDLRRLVRHPRKFGLDLPGRAVTPDLQLQLVARRGEGDSRGQVAR